MWRGLSILAAVLLTHYAAAPIASGMADPDTAVRWLEYIFGAVEAGLALGLLGYYLRRSRVALFACCLGVFQEAQKAVCGAVSFGSIEIVPLESGLCVERFGGLPYAAIAAGIIVVLWVRYRVRKK